MSQQIDAVNYLIREIVSRASAVLKGRNAGKSLAHQPVPPPEQKGVEATNAGHAAASAAAGMVTGTGETGLTSGAVIPPFSVSDTLAAFMVRSVALDPSNFFALEHELDRAELERLVEAVVTKIAETNSPIMETVKMQVYFDTNFPAQADFLHRERQLRNAQTANIVREICEAKVKSVSLLEVLYRKIVSYVLIRTKMGPPTDLKVVRETTAALESVFPQSELSSFLHLDRVAKETQLNGLAQLVAGIRLFNRALGKGGEGIDGLPELCALELTAALRSAQEMQRTESAQLQLELASLELLKSLPEEKLTPTQPHSANSGLVTELIRTTTFRRQILIYLEVIQKQFADGEKTLKVLGDRFAETVSELKSACRARTAVPVDQVYPHFLTLASHWSGYRDEVFLVSFRRGMLDILQHHQTSFSISIPADVVEKAKLHVKPLGLPTVDDERIVASATALMKTLAPVNRELQILHPSNTTSFRQTRCDFGGFCPVTLVDRNGLVLPGDRNMGLVRYRDSTYVFESKEAVEKWAVDPEKYIESAIELAKRFPPLIQLCHLYHYFPTVDALEKAKWYAKGGKTGFAKMAMVAEVGSQVDTHMVEEHIDLKYQWNEWELRRRALVLVNLKTKKTHSSQTASSTFRRDSETQHYEPKPQASQTVRNSSTQVVNKKQFLAGLRGDGKKGFAVVDLTLNI